MAHDPLAGHRVLGFDLETTGFSPRDDRIIQYALIGCDKSGEEIHLESLVNPQRDIPYASTRVHGIVEADVRGKAVFGEHIQTIVEAMDGAVIVGHNVERFDWAFLKMEFARVGAVMPQPLAIIDTLTIAKRLKLPRDHKLGTLCKRFDIPLVNAHTAAADAAATLSLLWEIIRRHPQPFRREVQDIPVWANGGGARSGSSLGPDVDDLPVIPGSQGWLRRINSEIVIGRGRHRGRTVNDISTSDPAYIAWLKSAASPIDDGASQELQRALN
jgi:DNA polymerase III epsilon subunit-like protein